MFSIQFTPDAIEDMRSYTKRDRKRIVDQVVACLQHEPDRATRNNKRLRPNQLAEWELRVGRFRVFYDQDEEEAEIRVLAVGHKRANRVFLRGEEFTL